MKLKTLLLIFILYTPLVNAVNLVCQTNTITHTGSGGCKDFRCEYNSNEIFSIAFDSEGQKIVEVTNFGIYRGKEFYSEEITPSTVEFLLPLSAIEGIHISIERVSGKFFASSFNAKGSLDVYKGKCRIGKKLF